MSDLRGLSRGSKTAAVVIVVVLLQVIVVAILGLGTIARDREEGARRARKDAERRARGTADDARRAALDSVFGALSKAKFAPASAGGPRSAPRDGWMAAFREVYRVDADGWIRSGGGVLLDAPTRFTEARADPETARRLDAYRKALATLATLSATEAMHLRRRYVEDFPFDVDDDRYALAVGQALQLAKDAAASPAASPVPVAEAILLAWQTAAINDGRPAVEWPGLATADREIDAVVASLPPTERDPLRETLGDLRRAREVLKGLRDYVLKDAQDAAANEGPPRVFSRAGSLVGVVSLPRLPDRPREALLVRIDRQALHVLTEGLVPTRAQRDGRFRFRVVQREAPPDADPLAARVAVEDGRIDLALDAVAVADGPLEGAAATGPRETFYWSILALAALGVTTAGIVLARVLRREVHLATLKADFVSNLSHELKTPLTSIGMFTEMIKDGSLSEGPELREGIEVIAQEADRLQRIVSRMIDVARREAASVAYDLVPGDLNAPVRAACERFRRLERDPGLALEVDCSPALPPVAVDAAAIDDAVTNLLSNAWKYKRGNAATIRVATRPWKKGAEVVVADDGIGIARHERRRVFEMFYRAENYLTRAVPGTGLGLALVRTIVRGHGGSIDVAGAPDEGTTFCLRFPKSKRAPAPDAVPAGRPRAAPSAVADRPASSKSP